MRVATVTTGELAEFYKLTRKSVNEILRAQGVSPVNGGVGRRGLEWPRDEARRVLALRARSRATRSGGGV